jgi:prepilin-type N-terminal cleavage/methylation domain-containing protein/prepilin-type processing-associated H-X9-DG protein
VTHCHCRTGMTLVEVTVVLAIIGVLIALLIPAVQQVRDVAARAQCANNLRQIGLALHQYHDTHKVLPRGMSYQDGKDPYLYMSWHTRLLPYLEQQPLWQKALKAYAQYPDPFWNNPPHPLDMVLAVYGCPADGRTAVPGQHNVAFTSYLGVEGINQIRVDGVLFVDSRIRFADVRDGLSNTLFVGERPPGADDIFGYWYAGWGNNKDGTADMVLGVRSLNIGGAEPGCPLGPYTYRPGGQNDPCDAFHFWSLHPGGAHFLFGDGGVRFLTYSADPLMPALATRSGGEPVAPPD